jgi:hypothetical protein
MKDKKKDTSLKLTIVLAVLVVAAAALVAGLNRLGIFSSFFGRFGGPTEKSILRNLDLADPLWAERFFDLALPPREKDFGLYSAFTYSGEKSTLTQVYASGAKLEDIRSHYRDLLEDSLSPESNGPGVLELSGLRQGRKVRVQNYYSEVSSLIQVDMELSGENAALIRDKVYRAFPEEALRSVPEIAALAEGESGEGYVMYNYDSLASDLYANAPVFSRAYVSGGSLGTLREKITALEERFSDPASAHISEGRAEIKHGGYLYQISAFESGGLVKAAVAVQAVPEP